MSTAPRRQRRHDVKAGEAVRVVVYLRISADRYGTEAGVDRQQADCLAIVEREGWSLVETITDNDRSASRFAKRQREGWTQLMTMVKAGAIDAVVGYDFDRLLRQPKELEQLIDAAESGLLVRSAKGEIDLTTSQGWLVARLMVAVQANESERISERIRAKLRHDATKGVPHWAQRPYGYASARTVPGDGGTVVRFVEPAGFEHAEIVPEEAAVIREMARRILDGDSATTVARWANEAGHRTPLGGKFQAQSVKAMLLSPRTAGHRDYHGEVVVRDAWAPILTDAEQDHLREAFAVWTQPYTPPAGRALLSGLLHCTCGAVRAMIRTDTGRQTSYVCKKRPDGGCGRSVSAKGAEGYVTEGLFSILSEMPVTQREARSEVLSVAEAQQRVEMLMAIVNDMPPAVWKPQYDVAKRHLDAAVAAAATTTIDAVVARLQRHPRGLAAAWEALDGEGRNAVARFYIDTIDVAPPARRHPGTTFDYTRLHIVWKR